MNNNENKNKILIKLDNDSEEYFNTLLPFFTNDTYKKELLYKFLFDDIININDVPKNKNMKNLIDDFENILENYISAKIRNLSNNNSIYYNELKTKFIKNRKNIFNKIKECNTHMENLKKMYINTYLNKIFKNNTNSTPQFNKKTVLIFGDSKEKEYELAEIFIRYLFYSLDNSKQLNGYKIDEFYKESYIESYFIDPNIESFDKMKNVFKYWFFIIYLISQIFSKDSNYDPIFKFTSMKKFINNVLEAKVKKNEKKTNKKFDKKNLLNTKKIFKKYGGVKPFKSSKGSKKSINPNKLIEEQMKKQQKKNQKKKIYSDEKKILTNVFEKCFIKDSDNLKKKYKLENFNENFKKYIQKYDKCTKDKEIKDCKIQNPFNNKNEIKLVDYYKFDKNPKIEENKINFEIYLSLHMLLNDDNENEIYKFLKELRLKLINLLYFLYKLKKVIYQKYIDIIDELFEINNNEKNNKNNINNNQKNKSNIKTENNNRENNNTENNNTENNNTENNNRENNNKKLNIKTELKKIESKIDKLENEKGTKNYDEKLLILENMKKQLIISQYKNSI